MRRGGRRRAPVGALAHPLTGRQDVEATLSKLIASTAAEVRGQEKKKRKEGETSGGGGSSGGDGGGRFSAGGSVRGMGGYRTSRQGLGTGDRIRGKKYVPVT